MKKKNTFTKILAGAGTILVWLPLLAPVFFSVISLMSDGVFRFDYLMPAELFPMIILGFGLLVWAAIRAKMRLKLIIWSLGVAVGAVVLSQVVAVVTGIASGRTEPAGFWFGLMLVFFAVFFLSLVILAIGGALLTRDLFRAQ